MANVNVPCPHCNAELSVDSSWDGQVVECPYCKREFCIEIPNQGMQLPRAQMVQPQQQYAQPQYGQPQQQYAQPQYGQPQQQYAQPQYAQPQQPYGQAPYGQPQQEMYEQQVPPKKNNVLMWVFIGCGGFILLVVILFLAGLMPALSSSREKARRISCASNIKMIMLANKQYSGDFSEKFPYGCSNDNDFLRDILDKQYPWAKALPAPLDLLVSNNYNTDRKTFECPSNPGKCSYLMVGGLNENDSPDLPVVFELPSNHGDGYINVGYVDGSARGIILPKNCKTAEQVAEYLLKGVDISSERREYYMRNVREAERQMNR